jgi:phosphoglycerol transferase MdoB-like AlkP superfamily enzyme
MLVLGAYLTFVAIEMPSNPYLTSFNLYGMLVEIVVVFLLLLVFHLLFQRGGAGGAVVVALLFVAGLAEYFVVEFKDQPIMVSDILSIGTAAAVSGTYTYRVDVDVVRALALAMATILMLSLTPVVRRREGKARALRVVANVGLAVLLGLGTGVGIMKVNLTDTFGIVVGGWAPLASYWRQGFLTAFITSIQDLKPGKPEGYSNSSAEKTVESYAATYDSTLGSSESRTAAEAQFASQKPTVIAIMNESFCDMSVYDDLGGAYTGPAWFDSYDGAIAKGALYVSPYGAGTCNTEFEFLTGTSMAFLGNGVYPYMVYDLQGVDSLASQLGALGYTTTAMHPNYATNWNRDVVYPDLGFDSFLDISDFVGAERIRGKVSDAATYDKILELLQNDDSPQFVFDVTMQNHSSYDTGQLPDMKHYTVDGQDDPELDEYLDLVDISDQALEEFIGELSKLDRPVVVVFFGDHQPKIASQYNDLLYPNEADANAHEQRTRQTCYMVWANYDVAGVSQLNDNSEISTNYLGAYLLQLIGAPLSDYQKMELVVRQDMPNINLSGYQTADGTWYEQDQTSSASSLREDLWAAQYHELFADGVRYQSGAGAAGML